MTIDGVVGRKQMIMVAVLVGVFGQDETKQSSVDRKVDRKTVDREPKMGEQGLMGRVIGNVQAIADALANSQSQPLDSGKVAPPQMIKLINPSPEQMRDRIQQLFSTATGDSPRLLYFCGAAIVTATGQVYLCGKRANQVPPYPLGSVFSPNPTMISLDWLLQQMEQSNSPQGVVILDCLDVISEGTEVFEQISCRAFTQGALLCHFRMRPEPIAEKLIGEKESYSQAILSQLMTENDFPSYTDYLVAGLATGAADLNQDGVISLREWHDYAAYQLSLVTAGMEAKMYAIAPAAEMAIAANLNSGLNQTAHQEYCQTLMEVAKSYQGNFPLVVQRTLDIRRESLGVSPAIAASLQKTVLVPYFYHHAKLQVYKQLRQRVMQKRGIITPENRLWLKSQQAILGLTDADIETIEPAVTQARKQQRLSGLILAGIVLAMLGGVGIYTWRLRGHSSAKICSPETSENCLSPSHQLQQPASLSSAPEVIHPRENQEHNHVVNENLFPIPTKKPLTLTDHQGPVQAVAIASGQKILATGSNDQTIKLWNLAPLWQNSSQNHGGEPPKTEKLLIATLRGHTDRVRTLAISADGLTLASGGNDHTIKIWDLSPHNNLNQDHSINSERSTYLKSTLTEHLGAIYALAFLPNQNLLISGSADWTIKIWDLSTNQVIKTLEGHQGSIRALAVSPDGHTLVSGSTDGTVRVWDLKTLTLQHTLIGHTDLVRTVAISPDGQLIASGSWDKTIKLWTLSPQTKADLKNHHQSNSPKLIGTLTGHQEYINSLAFTPDGQMLISGSDDNTIKIWQLHLSDSKPSVKPEELASVKATLTDHNTDILSLAVSDKHWQFPASYPLLVSGSWDSQIKIWW